MGNKKEEILTVARNLFNSRGYHEVTIRKIAMEMGMSSGNLNYHFKKREDIFEALYFEMVEEFDDRLARLVDLDVSIRQIADDMEQSMFRMLRYTFFWTDFYNLLSVSERVSAHFSTVYTHRISGSLMLFQKMNEQGLMVQESFKNEYHFLAKRMVNFGDTWIYTSRTYSQNLTEPNVLHNRNILLSMIYPHLTPQGIKEWKESLPDFSHSV